MAELVNSRILGLGHYLPERVVTNDDLTRVMDTTDEWILQRTGIRERRFIATGTGPADLALQDAEPRLPHAGGGGAHRIARRGLQPATFELPRDDPDHPGRMRNAEC